MDVVSERMVAGHPLGRLLDARWVDRDGSDWQGAGALRQIASGVPDADRRQRLETYVDEAVHTKTRTLRGSPDLLILDRYDPHWVARLMKSPGFADAISRYQTVARQGSIEYMISPRLSAQATRPAPTVSMIATPVALQTP
jgi:hypothetical protein